MQTITIEVAQGQYHSAKEARRADQLPMVYYGKGLEPMQFTTDYQDFKRAYRKGGRSSIFTLKMNEKELMGLVHDIQYHPVTDEMDHVDILAIKEGQKITAEVHLIFEGDAPAVKGLGGTFVSSKDSVSVECLPKDLPHDIKVDISGLEDFHTSLSVKDLVLPEGVVVLDEPEVTIATVSAPIQEEDLDAPVQAPEMPVIEGEEPAEGEKAEAEEGGEKKE